MSDIGHWCVHNVLPYVDTRTQRGRLGTIAAVLYLFFSEMSVAYGLSGDRTPENALGGQINWDRSHPSYPLLVITNLSSDDCTNVEVKLDNRFYLVLDTLVRGHTNALRLADFHDGHLLPRPNGMCFYELLSPRPTTSQPPNSDISSRTHALIKADQGTFESRL